MFRFLFAIYCLVLMPLCFADVNVIEAARHRGNFGLRVTMTEGTQIFLTNQDIENPNRFRARFYVRLNGLNLSEGQTATVFSGQDQWNNHLFRVVVGKINSQMKLGFQVRLDDGSYATISPEEGPVLTTSWHGIEVAWSAGEQQGTLSYQLDGVTYDGLSGLDNQNSVLHSVSMGLIDGESNGYTGYVDYDDYEAREVGEIGVTCFANAEYQGQLPNWPEEISVIELIGHLREQCR